MSVMQQVPQSQSIFVENKQPQTIWIANELAEEASLLKGRQEEQQNEAITGQINKFLDSDSESDSGVVGNSIFCNMKRLSGQNQANQP